MKLKLTVTGEKELQAQFRRMELAAQGMALDTAVHAGAEVIRTAIVPKAPVRTGTLRRSIHTEREK